MPDSWKFLKAFVSQPRQVGALWPSSGALARRMASGIDWSQTRALVEWGPGTGVLTREIVASALPATRLLAIEINPRFADLLRQRFPGLSVHAASVVRTPELCAGEGISLVDGILSGLPWAVFSPTDQRQFLCAATSVLKANGQFVTFAYVQGLVMPSAKRFRRLLDEHFSQVTLSPIVWANFPPALVYFCRR